MLKTNVDKILELLKQKKSLAVADIATAIGTSPENVQKTGEYLEEEGILKIEYKFMKPYLSLLEKQKKSKKAKKIEKENFSDELTSQILDHNIDTSGGQIQQKDYDALDQQDIGDAQFPTEITALESEEEEQEKPQPFVMVGQEPSQEEEESPEQETQEDSSSSDTYAFSQQGMKLSTQEIEMLISKAHELMDQGSTEHINEIYNDIYNGFTNLDDNVEKERIKHKIGKLFSRIKDFYSNEMLI